MAQLQLMSDLRQLHNPTIDNLLVACCNEVKHQADTLRTDIQTVLQSHVEALDSERHDQYHALIRMMRLYSGQVGLQEQHWLDHQAYLLVANMRTMRSMLPRTVPVSQYAEAVLRYLCITHAECIAIANGIVYPPRNEEAVRADRYVLLRPLDQQNIPDGMRIQFNDERLPLGDPDESVHEKSIRINIADLPAPEEPEDKNEGAGDEVSTETKTSFWKRWLWRRG